MQAIVGCETATVYRGGGCRYLTKRAAYVAAARAKINSRCDCEPQEWSDYQTGYMAMPCKYHEDAERYEKLKARLARWYAHLDTSNVEAETSARSDNSSPAPCSVCAAVHSELNNVKQYLDNAPHAEFDRANVDAFVRSLITLMDETPNARLHRTSEAKHNEKG